VSLLPGLFQQRFELNRRYGMSRIPAVRMQHVRPCADYRRG